jgi:ferredoxin-NADP reductase
MWQFETTLLNVIKRTPDTKTFRLNADGQKDVLYEAGQYFFVTIRIDGGEAVHTFTISSSPTETREKGYLEFTKRITSSVYSRALDTMKTGDKVKVKGAAGDLTLPSTEQRLCFLSGGIGITPFRSMLRYVADRKLEYDIVLLYGNRTWDNIAFRDELDEIAESNGGVRVEYILSGPDFPSGWKGKTGRITGEIIEELVPDYRERVFYASGPLAMVKALEEQLAAIGVAGSRVKHDYFPGYDEKNS